MSRFRLKCLCSWPCSLFICLSHLAILSAAADPPAADDPLPLRRILVPAARVSAELERMRQGVIVKMPRAEFEALVQRAARAGARAASPPRLTRTVYTARLENNALVGNADWAILNPGDRPGVLPLPDFNLPMGKANFDDAGAAVLGELDGKALGLLVSRTGKQSLFFDWSLRGGLSGGDLHFDLQVPPCPVASLELKLPADHTLTTSRSGALLSGPDDAGDPRFRSWRVQFGGRSRLELVVRRPGAPGRPPALVLAQLQSTQQLAPHCQLARYEFQVEVLHGSLKQLVFDHDPTLEPYEVTVARGELQGWQPDRKAARPGQHALKVLLREPYQGGLQPLRVTVQCLAPLRRDKGGRAWASPGMRLRDAFSQTETLKLQVHPDVRLEEWQPGRFRLTRTAPTSDGGRLLTLVDGAVAGPGLRPTAAVRTHGVGFLTRQRLWWQVGPAGSSLTAELTCTVTRGSLLKLPVRVAGNWQVQEVRAEPPDLLANWVPAGTKGTALALVDLQRALNPGETVKLTVRLRSPLGAKAPPGGLTLPLPDAEVVGASRREGILAIGLDPSYQGAVTQATAAPGPAEGEGPWAGAVPNFAYPFRGKPVGGLLRVLPQRPRLAARVRSEVQLGAGRAALAVRLQLDPVAGSPEVVDLWVSAPAAGPWKWSEGSAPGLVRGLRRQPGLEAARWLAAFTPRPLAAAAALAAPHGQRWRLLLARPLTRRETVTLETTLEGHAGAGDPAAAERRWDLPLVAVVGADPMDGELTVALAGATLRDARALGVREAGRDAAAPADRPGDWRVFRYGPALFPGQAPALSVRVRPAERDRPPAGAGGGREACDRSELTTYVEPGGRLLHHFRFRVWDWRRPGGGRRDLPVWLPAGARLLAARVEGLWLDRIEQHPTPGGLRVELPVPAGPQPHRFELLYASPGGGSGWPPWADLHAPVPHLPVPASSLRRTWRLPPGVVPLGHGVRRLPDPLGPGDREPWWDPLRRAWRAGRAWLAAVGPEFAPDPWAAAQRQQLAEAEQAVRRQHPRGAAWRLGEALERLAAGPQRPREALVVDAAALREAGLRPDTPFTPGEARADERPGSLLAPLGLAYLPCRAAPLLTTASQEASWRAAAGEAAAVSGSVEEAVAEAAAHGRDATGRFQTVAYWLGGHAPGAEDAEGPTLARPDAALRPDGFGAGWTEWEALPGGGAEDTLVVVRRTGVRALGLILAALFVLLVWRGRHALGGRWGFRLLMVWLAATFLALFWLPPVLRAAAWWPALAGAAVALIWFVRARPLAPASEGQPGAGSTGKLGRAASSASALVLLLTLALPAQVPPAGSEPNPVLILPGPSEAPARQSVLVAPDLLKRLEDLAQRGRPPARAVVLAAEYTGRVVGERAEFNAEFQVYCPTAEAALTLPLGGVDLKEGSLWGGARVYPAALPAPQTGYTVLLRKDGTAAVNTLRLAFSVRLAPGADVRELRFTVPRVPRSRLVLTLPPGALAGQAVSAGGAQTQSAAPGGPRVEADLGREGGVLVRWRTKPRVARPPALEVREAYLWDLRQPGGALTAVLRYTVTAGAAGQVALGLPEGLAVRGVDVAQVGAPPEGSAAARLKGWRLLGSGPGRQLVIDLQGPSAGEIQVTLGLVARLPIGPGTLKLQLPTPLGVARPGEGLLAYAVEGLEPSARAPDLTVAKAEPEAFAQAWQRLGLRDPVRPTRAYSFRRRQGAAALELNLAPPPRQARQDIRWRVAPRYADFSLTLTLTAAREDLTLVEWGLPAGVTVAEVTGPQVDYWSAAGGRLQVWLRQPAAETATARVEVRGWALHPKTPAGRAATFALPCVRLHSAVASVNRVYVSATPDLDLAPGPGGAFQDLQPLAEREPGGPLAYRAVQPFYRGEFVLRPSPVTARVRTLTVVQGRGESVAFMGLLDFEVPHGELRSLSVRLRDGEAEAVRLEAPGAEKVREQRGPRGERAWAVTLSPGVTRRYAVRVSGTLKAGGKVVLPELSAPGTAAGPHWLAVLGQGLRPETASGLAPVKDVMAELRAWPAEAVRVRKEGAAWRVVDGQGAVRLEAQPAGAATVRVLYAEQEAAVADLRRWTHQATYWLYAGRGAEPRLTLPTGARLLAVAVDSVPVAARRQPDGRVAVPLPGGEGPHRLRLRWAFEDGAEPLGAPRLDAPRFAVPVEPPALWRVDVPAGYRLAPPRRSAGQARRVGAAAAELARAEGQLRLGTLLTERLKAGPSDAALAQLSAAHRLCAAHCRRAADVLASAGGQGTGPGGKSLGEWLQELRQQNARLARVAGADRLPEGPAVPAADTEAASALFSLPERGLPTYWYGTDPGQTPRVALVALAEDRWRESASATELLLIALAAAWVLAYLPRVRAWLWWLLPEQAVLLGWLGTQAFGLSPLGMALILGGVCARLGIVCVWIQERLRGARPEEPPAASSFHSA